MKPFITLEEPLLSNIPSKEETEQFELYMQIEIAVSNFSDELPDIDGYFKSKENAQNDLAYAYEKALNKWLKENQTLHISYSSNADEQDIHRVMQIECDKMEKSVQTLLGQTIRDHLRRTGGNIGHFPYSKERELLQFKSNFDKVFVVKLKPFEYETGIYKDFLIETAELNSPAAKKEIMEEILRISEQIKNKVVLRIMTFLISTVLCLLTGLLCLKTYEISEDIFLIFSILKAIFSISGFVSVISIPLLIMALKEHRKDRKSRPSWDDVRNYFVKNSKDIYISGKKHYLSYDNKHSFAEDAAQLHKYYRFNQIWADTCGLDHGCNTEKKFYESIAPFVINQ